MCIRDRGSGESRGKVTVLPEDRGDMSVHGFWQRGTTAIFDIPVTCLDSPSYQGQEPAKVLLRQEKEKKGKYLQPCLEWRRNFTPLVYSADGMAGDEAAAA
eukprot:13768931-Ditylum_brightwellii.AAC.1